MRPPFLFIFSHCCLPLLLLAAINRFLSTKSPSFDLNIASTSFHLMGRVEFQCVEACGRKYQYEGRLEGHQARCELFKSTRHIRLSSGQAQDAPKSVNEPSPRPHYSGSLPVGQPVSTVGTAMYPLPQVRNGPHSNLIFVNLLITLSILRQVISSSSARIELDYQMQDLSPVFQDATAQVCDNF